MPMGGLASLAEPPEMIKANASIVWGDRRNTVIAPLDVFLIREEAWHPDGRQGCREGELQRRAR